MRAKMQRTFFINLQLMTPNNENQDAIMSLPIIERELHLRALLEKSPKQLYDPTEEDREWLEIANLPWCQNSGVKAIR